MLLRRLAGFAYISALAAVSVVLYVPVALMLVVSMLAAPPAKAAGSKSEATFTIVSPERKRLLHTVEAKDRELV